MRKIRRAIAMASAALALASATTLTLAGSASADTTVCGPPQGGTSGAPWYGYTMVPCVVKHDFGVYYSYVTMSGGSTDVRVYTGVYNKCDGVTYGINGDSPSNHIYPGGGTVVSKWAYTRCSSGLWGIARLTNSGDGSPWAWSEMMPY